MPESNKPPAELEEWQRQITSRLDAGSKRMKAIEAEVALNTEITAEIRDLILAAKVGFKVLGGLGLAAKWLGYVAAAAVSIWTAYQSFKAGGPPPK